MHKLLIIALAALGASATIGHATGSYADGPSYSCNGRLTLTERAICHDPHLSELDRTMARYYYIKRDRSAPQHRRGLQRAQRIWLQWRDTCGADRGCLSRRYEQRIIDLVPADRLPPGFGCGGASGYALDTRALLPPI